MRGLRSSDQPGSRRREQSAEGFVPDSEEGLGNGAGGWQKKEHMALDVAHVHNYIALDIESNASKMSS